MVIQVEWNCNIYFDGGEGGGIYRLLEDGSKAYLVNKSIKTGCLCDGVYTEPEVITSYDKVVCT